MSIWLNQSREKAEQRFRGLPSPLASDEAYRFGGMTDWESAAKGPSTPQTSIAAEELEEGALLSLTESSLSLQGTADGFLFSGLERGADSDLVKPFRSVDSAFADDKFAQLAAARWQNGACLVVPAGKKLSEPVRISVSATASESNWRHLVALGKGAEATLVLENKGDDSSRLLSELVEIRLAEGAKLNWGVLQHNGKQTSAFHRHKAVLEKNSELRLSTVQLGGAKTQLRLDVELGEGAVLDAQAACRGNGNQAFDFWTDVTHAGAKSRSAMEFWYVMAGKARSVFNGLIQIKHGANDCEAAQRAKSLLLDAGASVHAIPKLIIQTDAVKCAHGASVSTVNPEQLHYLQSRGIPRTEAEQMIVRGFTEAVIARLPTAALYARADALLAAKQGGQ